AVFVVLGGSALFEFTAVYSRFVLIATGSLLLLGLPVARSRVKAVLSASRAYGDPVWVVGSSSRTLELTRVLDSNPSLGLRIAGQSKGIPAHAPGVRQCLVVPDGLDDVPISLL